MQFKLALLAVNDIEISRRFYEEVFDQKVTLDLGRNLTFDGGFAIQQDFDWLCGLPKESMHSPFHNMELYFETDDLDAFLNHLSHFPDIRYLHPPKEHEWKQRVVRIYDPDSHLIEIGENMGSVAKRFLSAGYSIEETAALIQHPVSFVKEVIDL